ncbi:MAG: RsmE family RNA methyltransferase [Thermoanaerobaculia bacterium]
MKSPPSFFVNGPLAVGEAVRLSDEERRHARARRLRAGSAVRLIDAAGRVGSGTVSRLDGEILEIRVEDVREPEPANTSITVLAPVLRSTRLSWLIEKATELGAARVLLVDSSRAQGDRAERAAGERARFVRLAREAAKQCGRSTFPSVEGPVPFSEAIACPSDRRLLLDASGAEFPASVRERKVAIWVGPEGGFTPDEISAAGSAGWERVRLPGATLRAETAALAGLALSALAIDRAGARADNSSTR